MKNKKLFKTIFLFVSKIFHLQNWISIEYKEVASYIDIKNYRNNAKIREIKFEFIISSPPFLERASFIHLTNETNDIFLPPNSPPPFTNFPPLTSLVHVFLSLLSYRFNVQLALKCRGHGMNVVYIVTSLERMCQLIHKTYAWNTTKIVW